MEIFFLLFLLSFNALFVCIIGHSVCGDKKTKASQHKAKMWLRGLKISGVIAIITYFLSLFLVKPFEEPISHIMFCISFVIFCISIIMIFRILSSAKAIKK